MAILGPISVEPRSADVVAVCFSAMASPCEVLLRASEFGKAREIGECAAAEAWRIEEKYSRYRAGSVISKLNAGGGAPLNVDKETASLIDFAQRCYRISDGMFDVTSGILRRAWKFDGSDRLPDSAVIAALLPCIGFEKLKWRSPTIELPAGMELDFGGIGKEYAVDRVYDILAKMSPGPFLVNFGGDLRASGPPPHGPWQVGIEKPGYTREATMMLHLERGALATSGDSRRYVIHDGIRYGHVLNPKTGWPVQHAPASVTVAASSCTEAGLLSTLAILQGARAREFLDEQAVKYWIID
ncbi:MAG TPA: FAD:protein FMN transferase [Steroidobacteraceae bacterium]|jgi:thiamine biosynthesis lipoprotein|nr:FAD:protein FMN transferase [Steroidobacteraceae bacterium]